jgi:Response regulator containing CheY-like receiver domain and AraC-type DNA-binding domain
MYNILLTDDEQIMIDSLKFIIEKNFPGQVSLYYSLSGSESLGITAQNQIDIIFMDINMPGLDGLETLKCITQSKPETVIIILSAFDRFQYAQEAVNLGAYKYLTKPVNRNTVIETVRGAMNLVDRRRGRLSTEVELHRKLDLVSPMVESDFIYSAAFGGEKDVSDYFSYFNITDADWCFCCLEFPHVETKNQYELYLRIRDILKSKSRCLVGSFMLNRIAVFVPVAVSGTPEAVSAQVRAEFADMYRLLSINICSGIRAGVSRVETDHRRTTAAYADSLDALNRTPPGGGILFQEDALAGNSQNADTAGILMKLFARVRAGDANGTSLLVNAFCGSLFRTGGSDINKVKNSLFELLVNVRNITTEIDSSYHNEAFSNAFSVLSSENDPARLEQFVQLRCSECAADVMRVSSGLGNPIIEKACSFMNEHMKDAISLERTAQEVNVSPFYLSKLFKEEKNENFITYLTNVRMEKARSLLQEPRASVKEVSAAVGYNDQNYFSRLFRNKFGMTPTEYRDSVKNSI